MGKQIHLDIRQNGHKIQSGATSIDILRIISERLVVNELLKVLKEY